MTDVPPLGDTRALSWAALLARATETAQAAVALPRDAHGDAWRASIAPAIELHAVTLALGDLARLPSAERAVARDLAAVIVSRAGAALDAAWRGQPMPEGLLDAAADARAALETSAWAGAERLVWPGPGLLEMPVVPCDGDDGTLCVMQPGTLVLPGEPVACWVDRDGAPLVAALPRCTHERDAPPAQVYRGLDDAGRFAGDVVQGLLDDPAPGLPLLVPLVVDGERVGRFTLDPVRWRHMQVRAGVT